MDRLSLEARVENIDRRLERVEQILPTLATKEDLKAFPTREDAKAFLTKEDAKVFLTKEDAKVFLTKEDAKVFLTKDDAKGLLSKEDGQAFVTKADLAQHTVDEREYLHAALGETRRAIVQDMRVLFEEQQTFIRVLAEGIQACNERVDRVDAESRTRDARLDARVQRLEHRG